MVFKRSFRKRRPARRKRTFRKRKRSFRKKRFVRSNRLAFPRTATTVFRYTSSVNHASGATGTSSDQAYRLIGLYDPNFTGTGIQPRYFDTLLGPNNGAAPYHKYRVYKTVITVTLSNQSSSLYAHAFGTLYINGITGVPASWSEATERVWDTRTTTMSPIGQSTCVRKLRFTFYPKMLYAGQNTNGADFSGNYGADPVEEPLLNVRIFYQGTATRPAVHQDTQIDYYTMLYTPNDVANST